MFTGEAVLDCRPEPTGVLDLLIANGMIVDGTGNPGFYGAVGVEGERVRILRGEVAGIAADRVIDATGRIVCPGFIDMHAHSGLVMLAEPAHEPKVRQGVTTEVIGIDGCSYAPFHAPADFEQFVELNSGLDGCPPLPGRWSTVEQYLDRFTGRSGRRRLRSRPGCRRGWDGVGRRRARRARGHQEHEPDRCRGLLRASHSKSPLHFNAQSGPLDLGARCRSATGSGPSLSSRARGAPGPPPETSGDPGAKLTTRR